LRKKTFSSAHFKRPAGESLGMSEKKINQKISFFHPIFVERSTTKECYRQQTLLPLQKNWKLLQASKLVL
jgi:hypothetical protein